MGGTLGTGGGRGDNLGWEGILWGGKGLYGVGGDTMGTDGGRGQYGMGGDTVGWEGTDGVRGDIRRGHWDRREEGGQDGHEGTLWDGRGQMGTEGTLWGGRGQDIGRGQL